jgi:hypothetical protein
VKLLRPEKHDQSPFSNENERKVFNFGLPKGPDYSFEEQKKR